MPLPLVERSKEEISRAIKRRIETTKGVRGVRQLDVRISGKRLDVYARVMLNGLPGLENSHRAALEIERKIKSALPSARVAIDTEPFGNGRAGVWRLVKDIAEGTPGSRGVHNIHIQKIDGRLCIDLHLEVSANMTVKQAHAIADLVEKKIRNANPEVAEITVHIETASERVLRELAGIETELESHIEHLIESFPDIKRVCGITVRRFGDSLHLVLQCQFDSKLNIKRAHEISSQLESAIRKAYPNVARIDIHEEPAHDS